MTITELVERNTWLWVTRPEFYFDEFGHERADLEPAPIAEVGNWWTCHRSTRRGDLVLLYRTAPMKDIAYVILATADAYVLPEGTTASSD